MARDSPEKPEWRRLSRQDTMEKTVLSLSPSKRRSPAQKSKESTMVSQPSWVQQGQNEKERSGLRSKVKSPTKSPSPKPQEVMSPFFSREFTFTGYDILEDDLSIEKKPATTAEDEDSPESAAAVESYKLSCERLKVVPVSQIIKSIGTPCLKCRSHELGPRGAKAVAISLVRNLTITEVDIGDNHIGAAGAIAVADAVSVNTNLTSLNLSWNNISVEGAKKLCTVLNHNQTLRSLDISGNHLPDDAAQYVCELLEQNAAMKELCLSHNDFGEPAGIILGRAIAGNDTLETLDLSWNHLRAKGADAVGRGLKTSGLKHLDIAWNGFNHGGGMALASSLAGNSSLLTLDVTNNRLSPTAVTAIIQALMLSNHDLVNITMGMNPITPDVAKKLIKIIREKQKPECAVRLIDLGKTVVDEEFIEQLGQLGEECKISVLHGPVVRSSHERVDLPEKMYHDMDPIKAMFSFMQENGLRVVDLMNRLDLDNSNSVERDEFVEGMRRMGFPLSRQQLDEIMITMDKDGDGTVDLSCVGIHLSNYKNSRANPKTEPEVS